MINNLSLVLHATGIVLMEILVVAAIGLLICKIYKIASPILKKHEPAIRQRVHKIARAINW